MMVDCRCPVRLQMQVTGEDAGIDSVARVATSSRRPRSDLRIAEYCLLGVGNAMLYLMRVTGYLAAFWLTLFCSAPHCCNALTVELQCAINIRKNPALHNLCLFVFLESAHCVSWLSVRLLDWTGPDVLSLLHPMFLIMLSKRC